MPLRPKNCQKIDQHNDELLPQHMCAHDVLALPIHNHNRTTTDNSYAGTVLPPIGVNSLFWVLIDTTKSVAVDSALFLIVLVTL